MIKTFKFSSGALPDPVTTEMKLVGLSQQDAFACLHDAYNDRIQDYVCLHVADRQLAEDLTARVFLEAWERLPAYETGKSPMIAWLLYIARKIVVDRGYAGESVIGPVQSNPAETGPQTGPDGLINLPIGSRPVDEVVKNSADEQQQLLILSFLGEAVKPEKDERPDPQQDPAHTLHVRRGLERLVKRLRVKENETASIV